MSTVETHSHFELAAMAKGDVYKLIASLVMPRPIAWITSINAEGGVNAAPFSFFNLLSSDPPLVAVGFSGATAWARTRWPTSALPANW